MNLCPCGQTGSLTQSCECTPAQISKYQSKVSGPLLDRIDMHIGMHSISHLHLISESGRGKSSHKIKQRVMKARERQMQRAGVLNANLSHAACEETCVLDDQSLTFLKGLSEQEQMSPRRYLRILRLARTIADLEGANNIVLAHITEAESYRSRLTNTRM